MLGVIDNSQQENYLNEKVDIEQLKYFNSEKEEGQNNQLTNKGKKKTFCPKIFNKFEFIFKMVIRTIKPRGISVPRMRRYNIANLC